MFSCSWSLGMIFLKISLKNWPQFNLLLKWPPSPFSILTISTLLISRDASITHPGIFFLGWGGKKICKSVRYISIQLLHSILKGHFLVCCYFPIQRILGICKNSWCPMLGLNNCNFERNGETTDLTSFPCSCKLTSLNFVNKSDK